MKTQEFALSTDCIKNFPFDKYGEDFIFIVNGQKYKTSRIVADLLSPIIRNYHQVDSTITTFDITIPNHEEGNDFSKILSLASFESRIIDKSEIAFMKQIFLKLGNRTEFMKLNEQNEEEITKDNVFMKLQEKLQIIGNKTIEFYNFLRYEIEFISMHFNEVDQKEISKLPIEIIEEIIKNTNLQLTDEDSLIKFINKLVEKDADYSRLYEYVYFSNVSDEEMDNFGNNFLIEYMNRRILQLITNRSLHKKSQESRRYIQSQPQIKGKYFEYKENEKFNGIIKYLTDKAGGNLHDKGIIETSTNGLDKSNLPKHLLDFNESSFYHSGNASDIWIIFDFKTMKIKPTNYSIKCYKSGTHQLRSWVIETSNDGQIWTTVDEHKDDESLKRCQSSNTFECKAKDYSRYIRLHQTSEPWDGNCLWFHYIEFYGYLVE